MRIKMIKKGLIICTVISLVYACYSYDFPKFNPVIPTMARPEQFQGVTLILDAGHGGEDGGAVSPNGAIESQLNLQIATRTDDILGLFGVDVIMTRTQDISLHDEDATSLREKKSSDLQNRVALIENTPGGILMSIHQNTFTDAQYHGAQVFYGTNGDSLALGQHIQTILCQTIDPKNTRVATQIPDTIYLMNHITCPAILVECGFLSNTEEEALLQDKHYQIKLATALSGAYLTYDNITEGESFQ